MKTKEKTRGGTVSLVAGSVAVIALAISWLFILPYVQDYYYVMADRLEKGGYMFIIGAISGFIALIVGGIFRKRDSSARTGFWLGIISVIISAIIFSWAMCVALYL